MEPFDTEAKSSMSFQPDGQQRARFDVAPPDSPAGPSFGAALRPHWRVVLASIGGLAILAIGYGLVRTPDYSAETRLAVGGLNATTPSEFQGFSTAAEQLAETYSRAVQGDAVVHDVAQELRTTPAKVRPHLSAAPVPSTPVFSVTADTDSAGTSIDMSRLASEALVREANQASDASPGRLLREYEQAENARQRAETQVAELSQGVGTGSLSAARRNLLAAGTRADSAKKAYINSEQGGSVPLEIIQRADKASSDRLSKLQLLLFAAVVLGFIIGSAIALFLESARYPRFEESTLGRWELARRTRAQRARARRTQA
jgi:uncharacterized protein involved in exopolysaccharide biosynthesis